MKTWTHRNIAPTTSSLPATAATAASTNDKPIRGTDIGEVDTMASIEATHDVRSGEEHKVGEANQPSIEFPSPPALSRARANSHFSIRPALAALQNTFGGRQRAHSVSDDASQCSSPRSPMFARFAGLDPRSRTSSSVTIAPPSAKAHSSTLTLPIIESPDENISCAPRIPSFHDLDANLFSQDLGLTLGFNPRFSVASTSTVRAQEGRSMNTWYLQDSHMSVHSDGNSTLASLSDPQMHPDDLPRGVGQALPLSAESVDGALTRPTEPPMPGSASSHASGNIDENGLDTETTRYPEPLSSDLSPAQPNIEASTSHAAQVQNLYLESVSTGGIIPSPVPLSPVSTGLISPARSVAVVSPTRDRSFVTVSPARSAVAVSPNGSTLAPAPMGSTSPVAMPTYNSYISSGSTSPSHPTMAPVPFPSGTEDNEYGSDDASGVYARGSSYSRSDAGYDTPTLYTGTTNTSPTLSVTRIGGGEAPPALRLGPGTGFAGVGTFAAGGNVQGGVFREAGIEGAGMAGMTPLTVDGGLSVGEDESVDRLAENSCLSPNAESSARSLRAESTGRSLHAESSGRSVNAESSGRSVAAESSIGSGIRARVTSLRASQALSVLVPAFMKRARRKSHRMEEMERPKRGRKESNAKRTPDEAESSNARAESNHVYESSRAPSMSSLHPVSDEEEGNVSPTSSHLDLLSADPFASTVALKVGAWSQMYANRSDPSSAPLPPVDSADHQMEAHSECSGSMYGDDDSEEETSIRIYSHGRGRSMSQPDVYTIPIEPLHQSTTKRSGRSLDRRHRLGNWRRPALTARPSLPSLSTLTRRNVVVPIPRSAAAARFPAEPWDDTPCKASPLSSRGLGSLSLPRASPSPARGLSYPRSPMRSPMKMSSESSIAEDEEEEDEDEGDHRILSGDDDKVWWSGPSSRGSSSRRSSIVSNDEPTVSLSDPIVRDTLTTVQPRDSVMSTDLAPVARDSLISTTSHEEIDVSSESFLQTLDALDSLNLPSTPAPSSRTSSESSQGSTMSGQLAMGFDPRRAGGAGGAYGGDYQQGGGHGWQGGQSYGYNSGHGNGGNGNKPRRQADTESSESTSESESDDPPRRGRDTRGPTMAMRSQSMPRQAMSSRAVKRQPAPARDSSDESDNVPLAQRLPTALKAQKSIRIQDKAEREERRQRRMDRIKQRAADKAAPTGGEGGVAPDELAKRLLSVQVGGPERSHDRSPMPSPRSPMRMATEQSGGLYAGGTRSRTVSNVSHLTRSRTHTRNGSAEQAPAPPLPTANTTSLSRSGTMSGRRPSAPDIAPPLPSAKPTLSRNDTMSRQRSSQDQPRPGLSRNGTMAKHRGGSKTDDEGESSRFTRSRSIRDPSSARPPMPPMPPMESLPVSARRPSQPEPFVPQVIEQRIYIGDRQRFVVIDIGSPSTTAKDILDIAKQRGELELGGAGGWQLWEQSNECGMERPVRDFELISDVLKAWNPEKRVNVLIIRRSQLCGLLKPENMPSSSPVMSGWVMWVSKPGKWSKRWLELKEHGLFVSKNEKGKDRNHLCSLSHFDGYIVTHVPRAPKGYVFAAKSTDIAGVFEKEEDSSHVFSCDGEIGQVWLTKILLARSYVIQQERNVITRPANFGGGLHASKSMLSRSGTKKSTVSSRTAASQQQQGPLVTDLYSSPFNEGSLLAKHGN